MTGTPITAGLLAAGKRRLSPRGLALLTPWMLALACFFVFDNYLALGTAVLINILFVISLDLVMGYAGILTIGHGMFYGVGAYSAGLFAVHIHNDPLVGLCFATLMGALFGLVSGMLILHTRGQTLLILTLAISISVAEFANKAYTFTGGDDGLMVPMGDLFGLFRFDLYSVTAYLYSLAVLFLWYLLVITVIHSPFGKSLNGIRQNPERMRAIGTPVWWKLVAVYTFSAAIAGSSGALLAQTTSFIGLNSLNILISGMAIVMLVLGGIRRIYGAFIGASVYIIAQDFLSRFNPYHWMFIMGVLLILSALYFERGLIEIPRVCKKLTRKLIDPKAAGGTR